MEIKVGELYWYCHMWGVNKGILRAALGKKICLEIDGNELIIFQDSTNILHETEAAAWQARALSESKAAYDHLNNSQAAYKRAMELEEKACP
jgi:hypothetical protein